MTNQTHWSYDCFLASTEAQDAEETTFSNLCCQLFFQTGADNIISNEKLCKSMQNTSISTVVSDFMHVLFTNTRMSLESLSLYRMKIINHKINIFQGKSHLPRREFITLNIKDKASLDNVFIHCRLIKIIFTSYQ